MAQNHQPDEAPIDLPIDPSRFWSPGTELPEPPSPVDLQSALKRLGPLPFPRGKFPLMGFLSTVYEHVAAHVKLNPAVSSGEGHRRSEQDDQDR